MHCRRPYCRPSVPMWPCPSPLPAACHKNRVAHLLYIALSVEPLRDYFLLHATSSSPLFDLRAVLTHILLGQPLGDLETTGLSTALSRVTNLPSTCPIVPPSVRNILKSILCATTWAYGMRNTTSCFCGTHVTDETHQYQWLTVLDPAADGMTDIATLVEDKLADSTTITSVVLPCGCSMLRTRKHMDTGQGIALLRYAPRCVLTRSDFFSKCCTKHLKCLRR